MNWQMCLPASFKGLNPIREHIRNVRLYWRRCQTVNKLLKPCGIVLKSEMSSQSLINVGRKLGMHKKKI